MLIRITCPSCGMAFQVEQRFAGRRGTCPNPECRQDYQVPEPDTGQSTTPPLQLRSRNQVTVVEGSLFAEPENAPRVPEPPIPPPPIPPLDTSPPEPPVAAGRHEAEDTQLDTASEDGSSDGQRDRSQSEILESAEGAEPETSYPIRDRTLSQRQQRKIQQRERGQRRRFQIACVVVIILGVLGSLALRHFFPPHAPVTQQAAAAEMDQTTPRPQPASAEVFHAQVLPFLKKHCVECHGAEEPMAGLTFHDVKSPDEVTDKRKRWEKILKLLRFQVMPPEDHDVQPSQAEREAVVAWLDKKLFFVDCTLAGNSGRVTIRRLNRNEYNNTIRDLLGVDFKPADDFPSDDVGNGFDNIGDVLTLPPLLLEKYVEAAEAIVDRAILTAGDAGDSTRFVGDQLKSEGGRQAAANFVMMASIGHVYQDFEFPVAGKYLLRAEAAADQAGPEPARMSLRLDGKQVRLFDIKGHRKPGEYEVQVEVPRGRHQVAAAFVNDYYMPKAPNPKDRDRNLAVRFLEVRGPLDAKPPESHQQLIFTRPDDKQTVEQAATKILQAFMPRAFRRPVDDNEVQRLVKLVRFVMDQEDSFERAIQVGLQAVLVSPHFLFRVEHDPEKNDADAQQAGKSAYRLNHYEIASRLSYFLWSSMPDEELFTLAAERRLGERQVIERQVQRMLKDERSDALVEHFIGQWLNLRNLDEVTPDTDRFQTFTPELKRDMVRETEMFARTIIRENRSILDFLDADFTYVNQRLAEHYGIPEIQGDTFQRVALPANQRAGVLTHASILTLTSNPTRTSPVKRGKWILENILGNEPPPAPPNVPDFEITAKANPQATLRQQLEKHREHPGCASCHKTLDPLGFGFENFDAVGRWRDQDGDAPIDASGTLPGGETFSGPVELVRILKKSDRDFGRCFTEKLLTYALGRGLEYYDRCAVDRILDAVAEQEYRFQVLATHVALSQPFLMRQPASGETP